MSAGREHPRQAVILVGGEGTRLRPVTSRCPKPVAPVVERPFVSYILDNLVRHGVERAVFSTGFLAEAIEAVIGDGSDYGLEVAYAVEDRAARHRRRHRQLRGRAARRQLLRLQRRRAQRRRPHRPRGHARRQGRHGHHLPHAGRRPAPLRPGRPARGRLGGQLPGEARGVGGHGAHQRGRLRARVGGAGDDPARPALLDRARGVPQARRGRLPVRSRGPRVLARHRHAGQLSAGPLRHPRAAARDERR